MVEHRLPRVWLAVAAVVIAASPSLWRWMDSGSVLQADVVIEDSRTPRLAAPPLQLLSNLELFGRTERSTKGGSAPVDDLARAPDLKRVFDEHIGSVDPRRRRIAVTAFEACVPAFVPAPGQPPSPEPLIAALPSQHRTEREAAYRLLFSRCQRLVAENREGLLSTAGKLQGDVQAQAPGLRAQEAVLAGRLEDLESLTSEALNAADPAAVASLAGIVARIAALRQPGGSDAETLRRARAVDLALPMVACELGLDCSYQSLWALQLCAAEALCEGGVPERLMARNSPGDVDPGAVREERSRLSGLIRSGRTLHVDDLLPPSNY